MFEADKSISQPNRMRILEVMLSERTNPSLVSGDVTADSF